MSGGLDSTLAMIVCARTAKMMGLPGSSLTAVTMPCFGTTERTRSTLCASQSGWGQGFWRWISARAWLSHFKDIGHSVEDHDVVFENSRPVREPRW